MRACNFWERLENHPPAMLRLLARIPRGRPMEASEIAERSGLSVAQVEAISQQVDWRGIDLPTARAFMTGCRCDLGDRVQYHRIRKYLRDCAFVRKRSTKFQHLKKSDKWETHYLPLMQKLGKFLCQAAVKAQRPRS